MFFILHQLRLQSGQSHSLTTFNCVKLSLSHFSALTQLIGCLTGKASGCKKFCWSNPRWKFSICHSSSGTVS